MIGSGLSLTNEPGGGSVHGDYISCNWSNLLSCGVWSRHWLIFETLFILLHLILRVLCRFSIEVMHQIHVLKIFSLALSSLIMMSFVGLSKLCSIHSFLGGYIIALNFVSCFFGLIEMIKGNTMSYIARFWVVSQPYLPGMNPTWSECSILFIYCRTKFADILIRKFESVFMRNTGQLPYFLVLSLFSIWIMLAWYNELKRVFYFPKALL